MIQRLRHRGTQVTEDNYKGIPIHAARGVHEAVAKLLKDRLAPGSRVADLGAGHGALSLRLQDDGFAVDAFDFDETGWPVKELPCHFIDLNQSLDPLKENGPYDAICAIEVIEHLENPLAFIRDLCQGIQEHPFWLVISTPNPADTFSCVALFTRGILNWFSTHHYEGGGHISILPHWMIEKHLAQFGVTVAETLFLSPYVPGNSVKRLVYRLLVRLRKSLWKDPGGVPPEGQTSLLIARIGTSSNGHRLS